METRLLCTRSRLDERRESWSLGLPLTRMCVRMCKRSCLPARKDRMMGWKWWSGERKMPFIPFERSATCFPITYKASFSFRQNRYRQHCALYDTDAHPETSPSLKDGNSILRYLRTDRLLVQEARNFRPTIMTRHIYAIHYHCCCCLHALLYPGKTRLCSSQQGEPDRAPRSLPETCHRRVCGCCRRRQSCTTVNTTSIFLGILTEVRPIHDSKIILRDYKIVARVIADASQLISEEDW